MNIEAPSHLVGLNGKPLPNPVEEKEEKKEWPTPSLFNEENLQKVRLGELKVTVRDLTLKPIKNCEVRNIRTKEKLLVIKVGGKKSLFKLNSAFIIENEIYGCAGRSDKNDKLAGLVHIAPYSELGNLMEKAREEKMKSQIVAKSLAK